MQILVDFNIEGICIRQSLPDTILRILQSLFLVSFTNQLATSGMKMKSIFRLKLFRKLRKTRGWLELLTYTFTRHVQKHKTIFFKKSFKD